MLGLMARLQGTCCRDMSLTVTLSCSAVPHQQITEASLAVSIAASVLESCRINATTVAGGGGFPRGWLGVGRLSRLRVGSGIYEAADEYSSPAHTRHLSHSRIAQTAAEQT